MKIEQRRWAEETGWLPDMSSASDKSAQIVLVFGATSLLKKQKCFRDIKKTYPSARILGCSTAGEIYGDRVFDNTLTVTAVNFEHTQIQGARVSLCEAKNSLQAGKKLAQSLDKEGLVHVFVLSDGIKVNGSGLVKGLTDNLPQNITVTGGLAGDGERFKETLVFWDSKPEREAIAALGLYGDRLKVGYGSVGGWDPFGPERLITRSKGNGQCPKNS